MDFITILLLLASAVLAIFALLFFQSKKQLQSHKIELLEIADKLQQAEKMKQEAEKKLIQVESEKSGNEKTIIELNQRLEKLETDLNAERKAHTELMQAFARKESENTNQEQRLKDMEDLQRKFKDEFANMAQQILDDKTQKFTAVNNQNMETILGPLKTRIDEFQKKVESTYNADSTERIRLEEQVKNLVLLNQTLSTEAKNLTNALKSDTKKQGNWGEMVLERILQYSGLERGIHYTTQTAITDDDGKLKKPDVIVNLPDNKYVVIDSKMSLTAYERFFSTDDELEKAIHLKSHLQSIKDHIDELSDKNYHELHKDKSPDFVLMFIPVEPAFSLAFMNDGTLYDYAFKRKIIVVSVSTLLSSLKIIESMWKLDKQNRNAAEIVKRGSALYDKFVGFVDDMNKMKTNLKIVNDTFESGYNKLQSGRGNLIKQAEDLKRLGLDTKKSIPTELIENAEEISDEENE